MSFTLRLAMPITSIPKPFLVVAMLTGAAAAFAQAAMGGGGLVSDSSAVAMGKNSTAMQSSREEWLRLGALGTARTEPTAYFFDTPSWLPPGAPDPASFRGTIYDEIGVRLEGPPLVPYLAVPFNVTKAPETIGWPGIAQGAENAQSAAFRSPLMGVAPPTFSADQYGTGLLPANEMLASDARFANPAIPPVVPSVPAPAPVWMTLAGVAVLLYVRRRSRS